MSSKKRKEVTEPKLRLKFSWGITEIWALTEHQWMRGYDDWQGPALVIKTIDNSGFSNETHTWVDDDHIWKYIGKLIKEHGDCEVLSPVQE